MAVTETILRCPRCVMARRAGKLALRTADGSIEIVQNGRRYKLTSGSGIASCFCERCSVWVVPVVTLEEAKNATTNAICSHQGFT